MSDLLIVNLPEIDYCGIFRAEMIAFVEVTDKGYNVRVGFKDNVEPANWGFSSIEEASGLYISILQDLGWAQNIRESGDAESNIDF